MRAAGVANRPEKGAGKSRGKKPDQKSKEGQEEQKVRLGIGRMVNIENHENRFADMESGREADVQGGGAAAKMAALPGAPRRSPATDFSFSIK